MALRILAELKALFVTEAQPTEAHFVDLIDTATLSKEVLATLVVGNNKIDHRMGAPASHVSVWKYDAASGETRLLSTPEINIKDAEATESVRIIVTKDSEAEGACIIKVRA